MEHETRDVVVVGGGIAGLAAAVGYAIGTSCSSRRASASAAACALTRGTPTG